MKINTYISSISLSLALIVSASSCQKVLDVEPIYVKDGSQIFTTLADYELALTGAYSLLRQTGYYGNGSATTGGWSTLPDMMGEDLLQTGEDLANSASLTNYAFSTVESDVALMWVNAYKIITQCNLVLRNIEQFEGTNKPRVSRLKGQALALRAMVHFDLLRYWGENYDRNSTGLGIPYVTIVDQENKPARLSVKDTYDRIFADLASAETLLAPANIDAAINTATSKPYIDLTVVKAMLARINLYAGLYPAAETYAEAVITAIPLAAQNTFPNVWKDVAFAGEVVWSVQFSNATEGSPANSLALSSTNRNSYKPTAPLIALFDKTNDVRYVNYIASRNTGASSPIVTDPASTLARKVVNKYTGRGTFTDNVVNWKAFRTGEMYLIRAEARARQTGKEVAALADLNVLRAARIAGYTNVNLSGTALLDAILLERRKELFAEGHRWFDLKRTTRTITRTDFVGGAAAVAATLPATSRVWVFPIPQGEIDANPNIRPQQSPGWN